MMLFLSLSANKQTHLVVQFRRRLVSVEQHWSWLYIRPSMWLCEQVRPAAVMRTMFLSIWPSAPACMHCAHRQQQDTKRAPCATSQMRDQTSMLTIGIRSKSLITVNFICSSREITQSVLQLNCVFFRDDQITVYI